MQIAPPVTNPTPAVPQDVSVAPADTVTLYPWFWDAISPDSDAIGPGRLDATLAVLQSPSAQAVLPAPRLQALQDIVAEFGLDIMLETVGTNVSPALVLALIYVESRGDALAQSPAGAQGLMQLIPATAARFDVQDSLDPAQNIKGGIAYLDWLMERFEGDPILVLAAYNSGENALSEHGGVPPFTETRNYVPRVLAAFSVAKGLCLTPPLLASDGCVFAPHGS